ncbi:SWI/SNF-related matrix-associated actin-dependent regulator of chromatin subfamily B member 1 [Entomortierella parvispora]|uniref:SWI/SNF-related matrix-associated actin-dependent regulator of chromatin subfamily B member 1 n=1 Tax=Entomortierella parvispora TaxID=205924 RepID=A0A9P3HJC9_9FUNG|nr:SWI/SNF-related matrix-associated actin-dependent regulator of chromatin subfamily B member 1 [Entomortierella parvispora]
MGSMALPPSSSTTTTSVQIGPTPPLTEAQRTALEGHMHRDSVFLAAFEQQRQRQSALLMEKQRELQHAAQTRVASYGPGYNPSFGNGSGQLSAHGFHPPGSHPHIIYPSQRKRSRKSKEFSFRKASLEEQAQKEDVLVPIRLEIEVDGLILRDTFTWNLHESLITPEHFAEVMCEDMQFSPQQFAPLISKSIREQIQDYHLPVIATPNPPLAEGEPGSAVVEEKPTQELRILIKIDITVANTSLVDQFEWDISCPNNDPEHFSEVLANELGLGGEFRTAIAHSIREQVQIHTKCLNLIGYNYDGSSVHDEDLRTSFLPKITTILREEESVEQFTPILEKLTEPEIDKLERDRERDKRRKRRQTRGRRGVILPDREPSKTKRTLLHHGYMPEPSDSMLDPQSDMAAHNRAGPTTRRTATMAQDHSPLGANISAAATMAGQGTPSHYRLTRKLRGTGSDLSAHHLGLPGASNLGGGGMAGGFSRESLHGSKEKLMANSHQNHMHSPMMRETTPVYSIKEGE